MYSTVDDTTCSHLRNSTGTPRSTREIRCFSQEPLYTDDDKRFLGEKGITVLEDPMACLEVDKETLVISISPNVCVKQIITDLTRPAVMIWDEVKAQDTAEHKWKSKMIDGVETLVS